MAASSRGDVLVAGFAGALALGAVWSKRGGRNGLSAFQQAVLDIPKLTPDDPEISIRAMDLAMDVIRPASPDMGFARPAEFPGVLVSRRILESDAKAALGAGADLNDYLEFQSGLIRRNDYLPGKKLVDLSRDEPFIRYIPWLAREAARMVREDRKSSGPRDMLPGVHLQDLLKHARPILTWASQMEKATDPKRRIDLSALTFEKVKKLCGPDWFKLWKPTLE